MVAARVAPDGLAGVAALVPAGWRAVAVPSAGGGLGADARRCAVGDRVDVLATFDVLDPTDGRAPSRPAPSPTAPSSSTSATTAVTVAVPAADAARVAFAAARGTVTLALVGAG